MRREEKCRRRENNRQEEGRWEGGGRKGGRHGKGKESSCDCRRETYFTFSYNMFLLQWFLKLFQALRDKIHPPLKIVLSLLDTLYITQYHNVIIYTFNIRMYMYMYLSSVHIPYTGIFRGAKFSWFSWLRGEPQIFSHETVPHSAGVWFSIPRPRNFFHELAKNSLLTTTKIHCS